MEAELIAASSASDKALWFFYLLECLPFLFGNIDPSPIPLFVDNLAARVPTLSRFSESPSCWYLRVTLTPERPSYNSCIVTVHLLPVHPAHPSQ